MKRDKPRLTIEIDEGLRKEFKLKCMMNEKTMNDVITNWIEDCLGKKEENN